MCWMGDQSLKDLTSNIVAVTQAEYESALQSFHTRLEAWDNKQAAVEDETDAGELDTLIEKDADFRDKAVAVKDALITAWTNKHPSPQEGTVSTASVNVRLPKLDLPKFNGDVLKFMSFWQQFVSCVDSQEIPEVSKFTYLLSFLRGDARNTLNGLPVTSENYEEAKKILQKRFGRQELIIFAHIQALLSLQVATKHEELSHFYDKLVANVRALSALKISSDNYGVILTPIVV